MLWVAMAGGGPVCYDGIDLAVYGVADGLPSAEASCLLRDDHGRLWVGADQGCRAGGGSSAVRY